MKRLLLGFSLFFCSQIVFAQVKEYDIFSYQSPDGWKELQEKTGISYSRIDGANWAQIIVYQHATSAGTIQRDFDSDWKELVATPYKIKAAAKKATPETADGWTVLSGSGAWKFNGANVTSILTTFSNKQVRISVLCNSTAIPYFAEYKKLVNSLQPDLSKLTAPPADTNKPSITSAPSQGIKTTFKFNETKFDDGWVATVQEDWVEVSKGNIRSLIHYPREGTVFPADAPILIKAAWDILVAPRYSNVKNFKTFYSDQTRPYIGMAEATEIKSGRMMYVVLYRQSGAWVEIITPDTKTFATEYGFYPETIRWGSGDHEMMNSQGVMVFAKSELFNKLSLITNYNRFAVAASDLDNTGEWNARFANNTFYYSYNTGSYAGMNTYSSSEWFVFSKGLNYTWNLAAANSGIGGTSVAQANGKGAFKSLNNWQLYFNNIEGKPKTYDAYFAAVKNGRILFINDAKFPGSGIFTGFARKNN